MSEPATVAERIFAGTGELRALCRALDWPTTPLGPVERWSPTLRTAAQMVLASGIPSIVLWGPQLIQLYNDAYASIIRARHPYALGRGNREVWPEVWHINGPIYERVLAGETLTFADAHYQLDRTEAGSGVVNDAYLQLIGHRDIIDKPLSEALPEAAEQGFTALLDRVAATGEPFIGRGLSILLQRRLGAPHGCRSSPPPSPHPPRPATPPRSSSPRVPAPPTRRPGCSPCARRRRRTAMRRRSSS